MNAADLFCGFGGFTMGAEAAGLDVVRALNHNPTAIAVHAANHPRTKHEPHDIWARAPRDVMDGEPLDVLLASPDCRDFSKAKGGPIKSKRIRALPFSVVRWMRDLAPKLVFVENVDTFPKWGPCDRRGEPIPGRRGETFKAWLSAMRRLGYSVDWRILDSALYGAPTRRLRTFIVARRDCAPIRWPLPTHGPGLLPEVAAAEHIDWSIPCPSIFMTRTEVRRRGLRIRRPLAVNTDKRIWRGFHKFGPLSPNPYLRAVDWPTEDHSGQVAACVVKNYGGETGSSLRSPLSTITNRDHNGLACAYLINTRNRERDGQQPRCRSLTDPYWTITAEGSQGALVAASLVKLRGNPQDHFGAASLRNPLDAITAGGLHAGLLAAYLVKYYGAGTGQSLNEPLHTITTRDRMGLVVARGGSEQYLVADIGYRMLRPHELLGCQFGRFAKGYDLSPAETQEAQVAGIGGSVCPELVEALIRANVGRALEAVA